MSQWTKVVTEPLGLAGFAMFLIFAYLAKVKRNDERRWLSPVAIAVASIALIGGLTLAYLKPAPQSGQVLKPADATSHQTNQVRQTSTGPGSPNVQDVQGDVTVTVDQSTNKTEVKQAPTQKPESK